MLATSLVLGSQSTWNIFGTIHMRQLGYADSFIGILWAIATSSEIVMFWAGRYLALVLGPQPPLHLFLQDSMGEITFEKLDAYQAIFRVADLRPSYTVTFAGVKPGAAWSLVLNGRESTVTADAGGRLVLTLGGENQITLTQQG